MARDIRFQNVTPNLNVNTSLFGTGVDAINRGIQAFQGIGEDIQATQDEQQQIQSDLDLTKLRDLAKEQLGGQQAGETLEDYNASIDSFLKESGAVTENIGTKQLSDFRTEFEEFVTKQRATQEGRALTLQERERSEVAYQRAETEFNRKEEERSANNAARQAVAAHNEQTAALKKRLVAGETLTADETRFLSTDGNIRALEEQFTGLTKANPVFMDSLLSREISSKERLTLSPAERTALATRNKQEERFYKESLTAMTFRNDLIKDRIEKLDVATPLEPGDIPGGVQRFSEGLAALTGDNADIKVGDDITTEIQELMVEYVNLGYNPQDIATAALASTEVAEDILFFRFDETFDADSFAQNLKFAQNARESQQRQIANLEALGTSTLTQRPAGQTGFQGLGTASGATGAVVDPAPAPAATPAPAPVSTTDQQVQGLQADAAALEPGQPESGLTQAEEEKALEINVKPVDAKKGNELKVIAINQLTATEMPKVEANLEAAIESIPRDTATDAQSILRRELIIKLGALRGRIALFEEDQPTSLNLPIPNQ